jgi:alkylhydroperoxidase family enzyme
MRVPYIDENNLPNATPEELEIIRRTKERRNGKLLALDRALMHSPPILDGWNTFFGAIRTGTTLGASIREMIMCRIAVFNEAWYEWEQHEPLLRQTGVLSAEQIEKLKDDKWGGEGLPSEAHTVVLRYTDAMTRNIVVNDDLFMQLKGNFSDREVVEITATAAGYNAVSRFLVALDVGEMAGQSTSAKSDT